MEFEPPRKQITPKRKLTIISSPETLKESCYSGVGLKSVRMSDLASSDESDEEHPYFDQTERTVNSPIMTSRSSALSGAASRRGDESSTLGLSVRVESPNQE